jgi:hypothetical protein
MTKAGDDINICIQSCFTKGHISVPIIEIFKVQSLIERGNKVLGWIETSEVHSKDPPIVLQNMSRERKNCNHNPFYM